MGFETRVEDQVIIPAFTGIFNFKYAKLIGEGD